MNIINNKGQILIAVYMVLFVLVTISSSIALFNFSELNESRRYRDSTAAFWLAEAGINRYLADPAMLDKQGTKTVVMSGRTIKLVKDDSDRKYRVVMAIGTVGGSERRVQVKYPALATIFESTVSVKGDLLIEGRKSSLVVNDKLRLSGRVVNTSVYPLAFFEDKQEGAREPLVSINYPDADHNGVADEFSDFVAFNRALIARYPKDEVVYIKADGTYTITPDSSLDGKKIVYVEGSREGEGNAVIQFAGALSKGQSLTVIATGTVTHHQAGVAQEGSQLNIIAWSDYTETAALPSVQNGIVYTHSTAYFDEIHDTSVTNGSIIANGGVVIREVWSTKVFNYADMRRKGLVPPGFEGLVGGGVSGYMPNPTSWREI
jgi:hypothetical protein